MNQNSTVSPQAVYDYYCQNFDNLTLWKKAHFATRLAHWEEDPFSTSWLEHARSDLIGQDGPEAALRYLYDKYSNIPPQPPKNAAELRLPYFEKYPELRTLNSVLFRALVYIKTYSIDCRPYISKLYPGDAINAFLRKLFQDDAAVATLSTHAINAQYLYTRLIAGTDDTTDFDPRAVYELGRTWYDLTNLTHLKLYIYLYTHCIIGETIFYTRQIPARHREIYLQMLRDMGTVIEQSYDDINLDNKCEYLTCCRIMGYESRVSERVNDECSRSMSPEGAFIIDTHNNSPQRDNSDFNKSEHRNVLYIMASRPYRPQDSGRL